MKESFAWCTGLTGILFLNITCDNQKVSVLLVAALIFALLALIIQQSPNAHASSIGDLRVYVGYANKQDANFPNPWSASPNVIFVGGVGPYDTGAVRIDNPTASSITINSVKVDLPGTECFPPPYGCRPLHFDIWPRQITIPAGHKLILLSTTSEFDTSDRNFITACDPRLWSPPDHHDPLVTITTPTETKVFNDSGHILDTGGMDIFVCTPSESEQWVQIGTLVHPTLQISPSAGKVHSSVAIIGRGFAANSLIGIAYDRTTFGSILPKTDAFGSFAATIHTPRSAFGSHTIKATDHLAHSAIAIFTVIPSITLSASSGPPRTLITISGTGFDANSVIAIYYDGVFKKNTTTGPLGGLYPASIRVPLSSALGAHTIFVQDFAGHSAFATFTVT